MEATYPFETKVSKTTTRRHIQEDGIFQSHCSEEHQILHESTTFRIVDLFPSSGEGRETIYQQKVGTNFADKRRSL
jgi:hypothetical protein